MTPLGHSNRNLLQCSRRPPITPLRKNPKARCYIQLVDSLLDIPSTYRGLEPGQALDIFDGLEIGAIHPLFRREAIIKDVMPPIAEKNCSPLEAWGLPVDTLTYNNAIPAFALASALLHIGMGYFWTILKGEVTTKDEQDDLNPRQDILSEEEQDTFEVEMDELAQLTAFCRIECDAKRHPTYGCTRPCVAGWKSEDDENDIVFRVACLAPLWDELSKPTFQERPLVEKCNIWLMLSIILLHEIAHLVWMFRHRRDIFDDYYLEHEILCPDEPIMPSYPKSDELGIAWEVYQLGGTVWSRKQADLTEDGRQAWYEVHDCKRAPEIVSYREEYNAKLIQRISPVSMVHLMRRSTWMTGEPVALYVQCLQRIIVPSFSEMEHDSKHPQEDASDNISVSTCVSHDDCESESDPDWDASNPNKFWEEYYATQGDVTQSSQSSSSSDSSSCDSLYNDTKSERRAERRLRRERRAAEEKSSNESGNNDTNIEVENNSSSKSSNSDTNMEDQTNSYVVDGTKTDMADEVKHIPIQTFTYPEANDLNKIATFYDAVLTLPEENELVRMPTPKLSEDLLAVDMNNPSANLFTEEGLKHFDAQVAVMADDVVDKWLIGISRDPPLPSEAVYNDVVMDGTEDP